MMQCCSVPSHASEQHKQQLVGTPSTVQQHPFVNNIRQVNKQSVKYLICCILPGTVHTMPSAYSPSWSVKRTNETWCTQYPANIFPAMILATPLFPTAHHQAVAVSQCSAYASAGSSWIPPGAHICVSVQLSISMELVQTESVTVAGVQGRKRMKAASYQLCFFRKTGLNAAECIEKDHPKSKCAEKNQENVACFLLLCCYLVASCRQKGNGESYLKQTCFQLINLTALSVMAACVQLDDLLMG